MDIAETSTNARSPEIRAIILDYGEVLCLRPTEKQLRRMADVFGIDIPRFETLYEKNRRAYDRGDLTPDRYWFAFADEPGFRLSADKIPLLRAWDVEMWSNPNPVSYTHLDVYKRQFLTDDPYTQIGTLSLVPQVVDSVKVPVIGAGD